MLKYSILSYLVHMIFLESFDGSLIGYTKFRSNCSRQFIIVQSLSDVALEDIHIKYVNQKCDFLLFLGRICFYVFYVFFLKL